MVLHFKNLRMGHPCEEKANKAPDSMWVVEDLASYSKAIQCRKY